MLEMVSDYGKEENFSLTERQIPICRTLESCRLTEKVYIEDTYYRL